MSKPLTKSRALRYKPDKYYWIIFYNHVYGRYISCYFKEKHKAYHRFKRMVGYFPMVRFMKKKRTIFEVTYHKLGLGKYENIKPSDFIFVG